MFEVEEALCEEEGSVGEDEEDLEPKLSGFDGGVGDLEDVLIKEAGDGGKEGASEGTPDGVGAEEIDAFVFASPGKCEIASEDEEHAERLDEAWDLAIKEECDEEDEGRGGGADGGGDGNGQGAECFEGEDPGDGDDQGFCRGEDEDGGAWIDDGKKIAAEGDG